MNKYDILKSRNEYVNYTLNNYINCYNNLSENDIPTFTEMFDLLKTHQIRIGNHLIDCKPVHGIKLEKCKKKKYRDCAELGQQLEIVAKSILQDNKKDILFFQSITHLSQSIDYLDSMELMHLNEMFQTISNYEQSISTNYINDGKSYFYPYNRYPKRKK